MKKKTKIVLSSLLTIAMAGSVATGATYALFTSESTVNIAVTSGKVKVAAMVDEDSVALTSRGKAMTENWENGGFATLSKNEVTLTNITPGDAVSFEIDVTNESNVAVQYRTVVACESGTKLFSGLDVTLEYLNDTQEDIYNYNGISAYSPWTYMAGSKEQKTIDTVKVTVELPFKETDQNEFQDLATTFSYKIEAVQSNADLEELGNAEENMTLAYTATDMELLALKANNGYSFKGETIKLMQDIELDLPASTFSLTEDTDGSNWIPLGTNESPFQGTFDGNGKTIKNLYINQPEDSYLGVIGCMESPALVKDFAVENATVIGRSNVAAAIGSAYTGAVEGITVGGTIGITGNYKVGGISGYGYASIKNCKVLAEKNSGSYIEGIHLEENLEGDNVGGIVGFLAEGNGFITGCQVENLTISGSRKVGGIVGMLAYNRTLSESSVKNVTVQTNAPVDYAMANPAIISVGGIIGEFGHDATLSKSTIEDSKVIGFLTDKTGALYGRDRDGVPMTVVDSTATNVTVELAFSYDSATKTFSVWDEVGFAYLHDVLAQGDANMNGATIAIEVNLDMSGYAWTPVDHHADRSGGKWAVIDGKNHTISNLTIKGQALFTRIAGGQANTTIKNLTFDNATVDSTKLNSGIIAVQVYNDMLLDNVDVKNSKITGAYKVATYFGSVYDEKTTGITVTFKSCDVLNTTVTATQYDYMTCGFVGMVDLEGAERVEFENCTIKDVAISAVSNGYEMHANLYYDDNGPCNEADGVTVTNVTLPNED